MCSLNCSELFARMYFILALREIEFQFQGGSTTKGEGRMAKISRGKGEFRKF